MKFSNFILQKCRAHPKYIISQHGGSWGVLNFKVTEKIIPHISDNFLSWGHVQKGNHTKHLLLRILKINIKKKILRGFITY